MSEFLQSREVGRVGYLLCYCVKKASYSQGRTGFGVWEIESYAWQSYYKIIIRYRNTLECT